MNNTDIATVTVTLEPETKETLKSIDGSLREIARNPGKGECEMRITSNDPFIVNNCYEFECLECGEYAYYCYEPDEKVETPRFCPNCGRQVKGR